MNDEYDGYITKADAIRTVMFGANRPLIIAEIKAIPSADVRPVVHGKWVREEYDGIFTFNYCANCKMRLPIGMEWTPDYCPNCGAKMEMDDENN